MSSVSKLPRGISLTRSGRYRVRFSVDGRQVQVGEFDLLTHARAALDIARGDAVRGKFVSVPDARAARERQAEESRRSGVTLSEWADEWLEDLEKAGRAAGTLRSYRSHLDRHILPTLGDVALAELTPGAIESLMDGLLELPRQRGGKGVRNGVVDHVGRTLRACLRAAVAKGVGNLEVSPFRYALVDPKSRTAPLSAEDVASPEEVAALAAEMPPNLSLGVLLAAYCCLRAGEVLGLQRGDFEGLGGSGGVVLHVKRQLNAKASGELTPPKSGSFRSVTVPDSLVPALEAHLEEWVETEPDSPLFVVDVGGQRVSHKRLRSAWVTARAKAKPGFLFHNLRHTGLTLFAQQGATLAELLNRGGHSDVSVALRYQHATLERDRALTAQLDRLVVI